MKKGDLYPSQERRELMEKGFKQLQSWLNDLLRLGMIEYDFSEDSLHEISSRMVDAKLGGVARRIRLLSLKDKADENWSLDILTELSQLYLLASCFSKLDELSPAMQFTVLSVSGFAIKKELLPTDKAVDDIWLLIGQNHYREEQLTARRSWMVGYHSKRIAMLLEFTWGRQEFDFQWKFDEAYIGQLLYYPSSFPLRAHLTKVKPHKRPLVSMPAYQSIASFLIQYAKAIAKNPWIRYFPGSFNKVRILQKEGSFVLADAETQVLPVKNDTEYNWSILSLSGGRPMSVFGEWNGRFIRLLSFADDGMIRQLL